MRLWNFFRREQRFEPVIREQDDGSLPRENWTHDRSEARRTAAMYQASAAAIGGITVVTGCATTIDVGHAHNLNARVLMDGNERVPVTLAPRNASQEQKYEHYKRIVEASGGKMNPNGATVLGLRGLDLGGTVRETRARSEMVDTFVVLKKNSAGKASVTEFRGSSYPGQRASRASPDVNRDGHGDVGMITEGHYTAVPNGYYKGAPSYHIRTTGGGLRLPGVRDTNHDGIHSSAEWANSRSRGDRLGEVLFHRTGASGSVSSIGCLNIPDLNGFVKAVGGTGARFNFSLVNVHADEPR